MSMRRFTVVITPEPDGSAYNVTVPALPGCFTFGATRDEAIANAHEAITLYIEASLAHGEVIPDDLNVETSSVEVDEPARSA
jgi:antitoxin HicB